jgi:hypothetical protein
MHFATWWPNSTFTISQILQLHLAKFNLHNLSNSPIAPCQIQHSHFLKFSNCALPNSTFTISQILQLHLSKFITSHSQITIFTSPLWHLQTWQVYIITHDQVCKYASLQVCKFRTLDIIKSRITILQFDELKVHFCKFTSLQVCKITKLPNYKT